MMVISELLLGGEGILLMLSLSCSVLFVRTKDLLQLAHLPPVVCER